MLTTARTCGPVGGPPRNADELWSGLARKFAKDPAVPINWTENRNETRYVSGSANAAALFGTPRTRVGPAFSAALTSSAKRNRIDDKTGSLAVKAATNSRGLSASVSATLVETLPGADLPHGGVPAHECGLPRWASRQCPTLASARRSPSTTPLLHCAWGLDGDRVAASRSFKDTEFGSFGEFKQYVDHYRPRFVSGQGGGEEAQRKLDEMLTLVGRGHAGNVITGERRHMGDNAGKRLDFLYTLRGHHETQPASPARTAELTKIDAEIAQTVGDDSSWRRPTLYVLEALAAQRTAGLSFMPNAQSTQSVSGVRELSVLVPTSP
ncbi:hypothetical protein [Paraburkholderia terricola]|uniref:Uncharacterized protein n=1 Tax=Paraburkholderia terricola TaxID=169427 RepID=A0ABU1M2R9_9BURK|nr:hypothetical protein [Paraburkholderia terricola]MDR6413111.1 hypothetical protein [Paraburkholderia terricola]MDR6485231.1 hypothetical protein [Paraburkholderia terricola]